MNMNWKSFTIGIICGIIFSLLIIYFFGNRYELSIGGPSNLITYRIDKWTGKSWKILPRDNQWEMIEEPFIPVKEDVFDQVTKEKSK